MTPWKRRRIKELVAGYTAIAGGEVSKTVFDEPEGPYADALELSLELVGTLIDLEKEGIGTDRLSWDEVEYFINHTECTFADELVLEAMALRDKIAALVYLDIKLPKPEQPEL